MTDCSRCGDCCDRIKTGWTLDDLPAPDPAEDPRTAVDVAFIRAHWTPTGDPNVGTTYVCDRFDPTTRLCTAHDDRPPVCSGYPWYDKPPRPEMDVPGRCSFNADVRRQLPIVAVS